MVRNALFLSLLACGGESETSSLRSSSEPVTKAPVAMDLGGIQRPDGKEPLTASQLRLEDLAAWLPDHGELMESEAQVLLDAVNHTTAACEPCMTEGMSLGACLKRALPSCSNLPTLAQRAFRVAIQGGDLAQAQEAISFVEPWQPLAVAGGGEAVHVTLAVDYLDPFSHRGWKAWETMEKDYGESLQYRLIQLPHERHEGSREFALMAMRARSAGNELEFHRAVMAAGEGVTAKAISEQIALWSTIPEIEASEAESLLAKDSQLLSDLNVDSTPVVWVDGYRVTGPRGVSTLQRFVDLALADR